MYFTIKDVILPVRIDAETLLDGNLVEFLRSFIFHNPRANEPVGRCCSMNRVLGYLD